MPTYGTGRSVDEPLGYGLELATIAGYVALTGLCVALIWSL